MKKDLIPLPPVGDNSALKNKKISTGRATRAVFFILSFFVVGYALFVSLSSGKPIPFREYWALLTGRHYGYFFVAGLLFFAVVLSETGRFTVLIYMTRKELRPLLAFRTVVIGRFYSAVTPFVNGGQSFQTHALYTAKINRAEAFSLPAAQVFLKTVVFSVMLFFFFIFNRQRITAIKGWALIGLIVSCIFPVLFFVFSMNKRLAKKIIEYVLKIFAKLRLIKRYDSALSASLIFLEDLSDTVRKIVRNFKGFTLLLILYAGEFMALMSIPYFLFSGAGEAVSCPFMLVSYMYVYLSSTYVPIPGAAGAYELLFYSMYGGIVRDGVLYWLMLTMRFFTFFFYIIGGYAVQLAGSLIRRFRSKVPSKGLE